MRFKVAGVVFAVTADRRAESLGLEKTYKGFLCADEPEVTILARYDGLPQISLSDEDRVFDSQMVWSLYRVHGRKVVALRSPVFGPLPYRLAVFDGDLRRGEISSALPERPDGRLPNPLGYPLSEVLMICLLAQGRGLMVHACGILDRGKGYLFAGNSTHGKTTMARLWKNHSIVLNDDRIVLRERDGRFWMYGTPWHGEYTGVSPEGVPVEKVFFLRHAESNSVERKNEIAAASMLLTRSFPPLWDAEGMRFTLDFCAQFVNAVPCYELGFVPSERIIQFVRSVE